MKSKIELATEVEDWSFAEPITLMEIYSASIKFILIEAALGTLAFHIYGFFRNLCTMVQ